MSTIAEHNQLIKICFNGNKHFKHVLKQDDIKNMTLIENRFPLTKLPVCGSCESLAYWCRGEGYCKKCGTITKNPLTYSNYLGSGYDIDATGQTAKKVLKDEMNKRLMALPDYGK